MIMPNRNLGCCFDLREPDKVAITDVSDWDRPIELSYRQFDAECDALARGLVKRGFQRGDRIGILSLNRWEYLAAFFGTMRAGMVTVPISIKLPRDTIDYIITDAGLKAILHDRDREALSAACPTRISFDDPAGYQALRDPGPFEPFLAEGSELGMMLYTSGSTGRPKGVLLSHESQYFAMDNMAKFFGDGRRHRYVVAAPMFHMNATYSVKAALMGGASLVLMPQFNAQLYARAIARFGVTWLTSVPTMLALVLREAELLKTLDFSSVERVTMGSAPLTQALIDKVQAQFPKAILNNSYGTTEAGPVPFGPHPEGKTRPTLSVGYPAPGVLCELRDGPSPDEGVLCMKSRMAMDGYNNLPEKTREAVRDGWYRSGDIMRRDADGFFYFLGRADDMFVCGGENIWPGEVEKMLERLDGVHQAFVVPVPDEIKGQLPFAFIVRKPGAAIDEAQVKAFALANGPAYAHPRWVELVPELTLAATNKIDRRGLTARALEIVAKRPRRSL